MFWRQDDGITPLCFASDTGDDVVVRMLLASGANVNQTGVSGVRVAVIRLLYAMN